MSFKHKIVAFIHLIAGLGLSVFLFIEGGFVYWATGFGIVTPILLIIQGFAYASIEKDQWYREQMVPYISRLVATTEIETDRFLQYHRRDTYFAFILGYPVILFCQWVWTFGLTQVMPFFADVNDILLSIVGELLAYGIIFGPFILSFLLLFPIGYLSEKLILSRYKDIAHILDIELKWIKETNRRAKDPESIQDKNDFFDRQGF